MKKNSTKNAADIPTLFNQGLAALGLELSRDPLEKLVRYCTELDKWNQRMNLIAKDTPPAEAIDKHFLDSLTLVPLLAKYHQPGLALLDVGTGAGFPGLVLKIARPDLEVVLVEPREKRSIFLRHLIRTLELTGVEVITARIEEVTLAPRAGHFSFITSRALAEPATFLPMIQRYVTPETMLILMQSGRDPKAGLNAEVADGYEIITEQRLALPFSGSSRHILLLRPR